MNIDDHYAWAKKKLRVILYHILLHDIHPWLSKHVRHSQCGTSKAQGRSKYLLLKSFHYKKQTHVYPNIFTSTNITRNTSSFGL